MRGIDRSKSGRKGAHTLLAVDLQIEDTHDQRVAGLRAFDEERSGKRIVALRHSGRIAGLLNAVAKAIQRICLENISRPQTRHRLGHAENIFHVVERALVVHYIGRGSSRHVLGGSTHHQAGHP